VALLEVLDNHADLVIKLALVTPALGIRMVEHNCDFCVEPFICEEHISYEYQYGVTEAVFGIVFGIAMLN
jgi:hypothetical protein